MDDGTGTGPTASAVLLAAAELLSKPGAWTQHADARDEDGDETTFLSPEARCWCAAGAIAREARRLGGPSWSAQVVADLEIAAQRRLALELGWSPSRYGARPVDRIVQFNDEEDLGDDEGRTQDEVVAALRRAAKGGAS